MKIHLFDKSTDFVILPPGQTVFNEGEPGDRMYAIIAGSVDIVAHGKVIETVEAGGVFGEMALVENRPRSASVVVKSEAKLVPIDRNRFLFLVQQTPFFSLQLLAIVAERLRKFVDKA